MIKIALPEKTVKRVVRFLLKFKSCSRAGIAEGRREKTVKTRVVAFHLALTAKAVAI
ncbi:hypothetical protein [[Phormidium] sp. LEGE 05292]|uniref:hypothetical protein n=1 Tax=[Phormidium] sp. LEGE 05292 TaxID=767427 RepID=UPI0018821E12|nr:hypothetical protein [Phormidium sp. LEGE 05292]